MYSNLFFFLFFLFFPLFFFSFLSFSSFSSLFLFSFFSKTPSLPVNKMPANPPITPKASSVCGPTMKEGERKALDRQVDSDESRIAHRSMRVIVSLWPRACYGTGCSTKFWDAKRALVSMRLIASKLRPSSHPWKGKLVVLVHSVI